MRRGRVLGGPSARAAFGGNLNPALVATQGGRVRVPLCFDHVVRRSAGTPSRADARVVSYVVFTSFLPTRTDRRPLDALPMRRAAGSPRATPAVVPQHGRTRPYPTERTGRA